MLIGRYVSDGVLGLDDDDILQRIYSCTGCRSCEQQCGVYHHDHIFEVVQALRTEAVTQGLLNPAYTIMIDNLRRNDSVFDKPKSERGEWAKGTGAKEATSNTVDVLFHAGCLFSFDSELWNVPRSVIKLMRAAGVNAGIMGKEEACCGGRAYEIGYTGEFTKYAQHCIDTFNSLGVSKVITSCSDCYSTFKTLYPKLNKKMNFETMHVLEFLEQLIKESKLGFSRRIPLKVTYHDPCHLGRHLSQGVYDPPRKVLTSIPGIELVEMERTRENAWCCGAGAGVSQANPELALWTANERLKEAKSTGADALVTSCGWCERNFRDAAKEYGIDIEIYDVTELACKAI
jgi:Fe-S oxidoreductase